MKNPFKKQHKEVEGIRHKEHLTGYVRFVDGNKIKHGKIFGKPYTVGIMIPMHYHIEDMNGKVYDIPEHAIEQEEA